MEEEPLEYNYQNRDTGYIEKEVILPELIHPNHTNQTLNIPDSYKLEITQLFNCKNKILRGDNRKLLIIKCIIIICKKNNFAINETELYDFYNINKKQNSKAEKLLYKSGIQNTQWTNKKISPVLFFDDILFKSGIQLLEESICNIIKQFAEYIYNNNMLNNYSPRNIMVSIFKLFLSYIYPKTSIELWDNFITIDKIHFNILYQNVYNTYFGESI